MTAHIEVSVQPPDLPAAVAALAAVIAIDVAALRWHMDTRPRDEFNRVVAR